MKLETPWKCQFVSSVFCFPFLGSAYCCCVSLVLESPAFIAQKMSHFPAWGRLRKMGLSTVEWEFTQVVVLMRALGGHAELSFGKKNLWLKNLSLTCCEMKSHKHFLCQTLQDVEALLMHFSPSKYEFSDCQGVNNQFYLDVSSPIMSLLQRS